MPWRPHRALLGGVGEDVFVSATAIRDPINVRQWEACSGARTARALTISAIQLIGLIGLAMALLARRPRYWIPAVYIGIVAVFYGFFQPMPRHGFIIYPCLCFPAVQAIAAAIERFSRESKRSSDKHD